MSTWEWVQVIFGGVSLLIIVVAAFAWPERECFQCGGEFPDCVCVVSVSGVAADTQGGAA